MGARVDLPQPGDTFADKYAIVRLIGEGGMGSVYEANHLRLRQRVAIKLLLPALRDVPEVVLRFEREGRTAAQLRGRNVARIIDVDTTSQGLPYIVMEYLEGRDLDTELHERGPLPIAEAVGYVLQACDAMLEAHAAGIVHRDLKPANLFLCPERDQLVVKVLDFGISRNKGEDDARLTGTHATVGTPLYMSPEQVRSAKNVDARTDIWALGVILFELLTGRPPFIGSMTSAVASIVADPAPPLRDLRADAPPELELAILRALEKDPARRFPDVGALVAAIAPFGPGPSPSVHSAKSAGLVTLGATGLVHDSSRGLDSHSASDSTFSRAETVSSRDLSADVSDSSSSSLPAAVSARGKPPATSPGWVTQNPSRSGRRAKTLTLVAAAPILAIAVVGARFWLTPPSNAPAAPSLAIVPIAPDDADPSRRGNAGAGSPVQTAPTSSTVTLADADASELARATPVAPSAAVSPPRPAHHAPAPAPRKASPATSASSSNPIFLE